MDQVLEELLDAMPEYNELADAYGEMVDQLKRERALADRLAARLKDSNDRLALDNAALDSHTFELLSENETALAEHQRMREGTE